MRKLCSDDEEGQEKSSPESSTPHASDVGTPQSSPEKMLVIKPKRKHVFDSDSEDESHKRDAKRRKLEIRVKRLEESPYKMPSVEKLRVKRIEESPRRTPSVEKMRVKRIGESPRKIPSVESDTDDSMDVPLAQKKKQLQEGQTADTACVNNPADIDRTSDSDQSDLDSDLKETPTKKSSNGHVADSSESDFQMLGGSSGALRTKQRYSEHSDSESEVSEISSIKGSNVDLPEEKVSNVSTERVKQKKKKSLADSDVATGVSSDEDEPIIKTKSKIKKKQGSSQSRKKAAAGKTTVKESNRLKSLRKICQACGMFVWNDPELKECTSDVARIKRLKTLLTAAGMKGRPSLKKAEEIKLQKEAAELNSNNIISNEPSRGKRKVASKYSRRVKSPKKSQSPQKPVSNPFSRLKGIVDSENSDSD